MRFSLKVHDTRTNEAKGGGSYVWAFFYLNLILFIKYHKSVLNIPVNNKLPNTRFHFLIIPGRHTSHPTTAVKT